jgi:fimbrial chaperone protein
LECKSKHSSSRTIGRSGVFSVMRIICKKSFFRVLTGAAVVGVAMWSGPSNAMLVTPLVDEMQATGSKSKTIVRVTNDGAQPLPIEFKFNSIELDENGVSTYTPADGDFKIFPQRSSIDPGKTQVFQVQYLNKTPLEKSKNYKLAVNQLAVKFPSSTTGVQVVYNMGVILNVSPPNAQGSLQVISAGVTGESKVKARPMLILQNSGNRHVNLADATVNLSSGKWSKVLTSFELKQLIGLGLVQAGKRRKFILPIDLPAGVTSMTATIETGTATTALAR